MQSSEIDDIIRRARAEYNRAHSIEDDAEELSTSSSVESTEAPIPNLPTVDETIPDVVENIPESSLVSESTSRFSSAIWYDNIKAKFITLAGLGGIGSYVAFLLARMNPARINLYDDDIIEEANLSGQLYGGSDIGLNKVDSISRIMREFSRYYDTYTYTERFTESSTPADIMICGFDNMEARRTFYEVWKSRVNSYHNVLDRGQCLFIDGRLAAEEFQVFCIKGDDIYNMDKYEKEWLFSDEEAESTICSYKQTTFMANMIGSIIVNLFVNFCANQCDVLVPRDLPFLTTYTADTMFFKTIN